MLSFELVDGNTFDFFPHCPCLNIPPIQKLVYMYLENEEGRTAHFVTVASVNQKGNVFLGIC